MQRLEQDVMLVCHDFSEEGVTNKMLLEARVIQLGEVVSNLRQQITELEVKISPSTPPEVL